MEVEIVIIVKDIPIYRDTIVENDLYLCDIIPWNISYYYSDL